MKKPLPIICICLFWAVVLLFAPGLGPANLEAQGESSLRIESWTKHDRGMELDFVTEWGSRYRVESSTNVLVWNTILVTEPARGPSLTVLLEEASMPVRFYRVSLFDWEELRTDLQIARQRWEEQGRLDYEFDFRWQCGCHPDFTSWVRVTVRDGALQHVASVLTGEVLPEGRWGDYLTVAGLFDWIESQLDQRPEDVQLEFDPEWGTPLSGFIDQSSLIADEEMGFEVAGFPQIQMPDNFGGGLLPGDAESVHGIGQAGDFTGRIRQRD
jgi:hypothetical protein